MKIRPLSESLQEKAKNELNEIPHQIEENLAMFRNWLSKQEHIKYKDDEQLLISFLRLSKFRIQRAQTLLEGYYTFRTIAPELTTDLDPLSPDIQNFLRIGMCFPLPLPEDDPASARVVLLRFGNYNPEEVTQTTMVRGGYAISEIFLNEDDNFVVAGVKAIFDMRGAHMKTAFQVTPTMIKNLVYYCEKSFTTRLKGLYVLNLPAFYEPILNAITLLISKKLTERLHFYSNNNWESFYKDVPKSILPFEYGGSAGSVEDLAAKWKSKIESCREALLNEDNYNAIKSKTNDEETDFTGFGIQGTFRKLKID